MKKVLHTTLFLMVGMLITGVIGAADKEAIEKQIKNQVDEVVTAIDGGKKAKDFEILAKREPYYVFIMEPGGTFLFHPRYSGHRLERVHYDALIKGTTEGLWVEYELEGKMKHTYVKKTKGGLFVGSGYND